MCYCKKKTIQRVRIYCTIKTFLARNAIYVIGDGEFKTFSCGKSTHKNVLWLHFILLPNAHLALILYQSQANQYSNEELLNISQKFNMNIYYLVANLQEHKDSLVAAVAYFLQQHYLICTPPRQELVPPELCIIFAQHWALMDRGS